ncbi:TPA: VCBS repeat-containing protein, partial [Candidatus Delongbacteria bacterium]|nr:VCBS repeat-containing protein [Candidatus Delongbacteria bacterium]
MRKIIFVISLFTTILYADFTEISTALPDICFSNVAWGDYDSDGDLDILMTGETDSSYVSRVYRNDGSNVFTDIEAGLLGLTRGKDAARWGDYDNDGDLDVLICGTFWDYNIGESVEISRIYKNEGNDVFTDINAGLIGVDMGSVAFGDYDNDGDLDVLISGVTSVSSVEITTIYRNDGGGTFTDINAGLIGVQQGTSAWGDYDNDGDLDVIVTGYDYTGGDWINYGKIYRNEGNGIFTDINAAVPYIEDSSVSWGDYDNDGDLDLFMTGLAESKSVWMSDIYRNDGNGIFTRLNAPFTDVRLGSSAFGDYDNDSDLDILMTGTTSSGNIGT